MGPKQSSLFSEVRSNIDVYLLPLRKGWRPLLPLALLLSMLLLFGLWATLVLLVAVCGAGLIFLVVRANSRWLREDERRSKEQQRVKSS